MNLLLKISGLIDNLNKKVGKIAGYVALLMVLVVFVDVVMRYAFKSSFVFTQELEWHLFAFVFLLGAGYTLFLDGHVRVDIFYQKLSPKGRAWTNMIGVLLFLIPGCLLIIKTSLVFVYNAWIVSECSPDPGGIPLRFIVKSFIPIGFVLVFLQGISLGIKSFAVIAEKDIKTEEHTKKG
ncbi:MAG: TRAP transporter small permease subunit [Deltaproteobacteria bacterium]|nr:TRAP transporter small permease subunit [Deltaproteobacteria bacterium]